MAFGLLLLPGLLSASALAQDGTPSPTPPAEQIAFEIYPKGKILGDFFEPEVKAGESIELVVVLANTGDLPFEGRTYAINAFTEVNGGFAVAESGTPPSGVTTWLDYPEQVYAIEVGQGLERLFTVSVPEGTAPGEYITSLILENAEPMAVAGTENFDQITRFTVPVLITVPGPIETALAIGDADIFTDETATTIEIPVTNSGNVRVRPSGMVDILDDTGNRIYTAPVAMGSVFARETTTLRVPLPAALDPGHYEIRVDLSDAERNVSASGSTDVTAAAPATPEPPPPVQITALSREPRPSPEDVQFIDIVATIENGGEPLTGVRFVLRVAKDGTPVEDYPISSSLSLPVGRTEIQERYIPGNGWEPGTWEFTLSLEVVDPGTGVARVIATSNLPALVIP